MSTQQNLCKYHRECKKFNPATTLTVILGVKGYPESYWPRTKTNICVNGGGCGCGSWRHYTNKEMGWYEPFPNRAGKVEASLKFKIGEKP